MIPIPKIRRIVHVNICYIVKWLRKKSKTGTDPVCGFGATGNIKKKKKFNFLFTFKVDSNLL